MCIRDSIKGSALKALEDPSSEWGNKIMELMDTVDSYIPEDVCKRQEDSRPEYLRLPLE